MKHVKTTVVATLLPLLLIAPSIAYANWYWVSVVSEPNTGYFIEEISPNTIGYTPTETPDPYANKTLVPDDFMDTMDETKASDKCSGELDSAIQRLRQFDASEEIVDPSANCRFECSPYYANPQTTIEAREQLLLELESDARSCLVNEQKEIEKAIEEHKRKEAEEAREAGIAEAVTNCDQDFFESMTTAEKMDTYNERQACAAANEPKELVEEIVEESRSSETPVAVRPEATEVVEGGDDPCGPGMWGRTTGGVGSCAENTTEESDTSVSEPANSNNTRSNRSTAEAHEEAESTTTEDTDSETVATTDSTEAVAEAAPDATSKPEPKPKATFFQRVVNFFTGWFK